MRHWLLLLVLVLASAAQAFADERIDSLNVLLSKNPPDTMRVRVYIDLAYRYRYSDPEKASYYLNEAEALALKTGFIRGTNSALRVRAMLFAREDNYAKSFELIYKVIDASEQDNDIQLLTACYLSLGDILLNNRSYELAQKNIEKAFDYSQQAGDVFTSGYAKRLLANISYKKAAYHRATEEYKTALQLYEAAGREGYSDGVLNDIGLCFTNMREYDSALYYFNRALDIAREYDRDFIWMIRGNMGEVYMYMKQYDRAIGYLREDINHNRGNRHELSSVINTYTQLANCYAQKNELKTAEAYIDSALELRTRKGANHDYIIASFQLKAHILTSSGNYKGAYEAIMEAMAIRESEHIADESVSVLEKQVSNEATRQEKILDDLKGKLSIEKKLSYFYIIITVLAIFMIVIIFYSYLRSRKSLHTLQQQYRLIEQQQSELDEKTRQIANTNTNLINANSQLKELNEEKNEFIRLVAHDLKNPISRVSGLSYLIEMEPDSKVIDQLEKLEYIKQSAGEMTDLIERFLDVNRIESGQQKIKLQELNLLKMLESETEHFRMQAKEKMIDLRFLPEPPVPMIESDPQIIKLIFNNLLSNAIKFSSFGKPVEVILRHRKDRINLIVKDYGPGMTEQDKQKVFRKYTRLSARPTGNETSTGLGLYLVKKMSEKISAEITFDSTLGSGTEMCISLPMRVSEHRK